MTGHSSCLSSHLEIYMPLTEDSIPVLIYRNRPVYDIKHSFSKFFERGLKHRQPELYAEIAGRFQLNTDDSEKNVDFEQRLPFIKEAYEQSCEEYLQTYKALLQKGVEAILADGDRPDQYILVPSDAFPGIELQWREDDERPGHTCGYTATSLSPSVLQWMQADTETFIERFRTTKGKTLFDQAAPIEHVYHRFEWPDDMTDIMFPAYIFLDGGALCRTFKVYQV